MADDFEYVPDPVADTNENPTWGDYGKSVASGVTGGALAPAAAAARYATQDDSSATGKFANDMARILQRHLNVATDDINESRTDVARQRAEAAVTSSDFWEHPISGTLLKASGMTGPMAAAIFSGGPVGSALVSGALSEGSYLNEIDKALDAANDAALRQNSYYESLRSMGLDEQEARAGLKRKLVGQKDLLNFAVGALAGALGPAGKAAAGVSGKAAMGLAGAEAGIARRAGMAAAEGVATEGAQEGTEDATTQLSLIEGGLKKEFDKEQLANAVAEGALLGGVFGGGIGAATGGKGKAKAAEIKAKRAAEQPADEPIVTPEVKPEDVNQQPKGAGTGNQVPPVETAPTGDKQNQPTRSETQYPKTKGRGNKVKNEGVVVEVVDPGAPSVAETAAVADLQQKTQPEPTLPKTPNVQAPPAAPPVAPSEAQPGVPPPGPGPVAAAPPAPEVPVQAAPPIAPVEAAPDPAVTPEVTPPIAAPVEAPQPDAPRAPRVLQVIKDKAAQEAEAKAAKEAFKGLNANAKAEVALEANEGQPAAPKGKNWTKKQMAEREASATNARGIFDRHVPEDDVIAVTPAERTKLRERLGAMLAEVDTAGVKIPLKVGYDGTNDHIVYMRAAKDLHKKLGQKSFTGQRAAKQVADFMIAERAAKKGDFSVLRETRKVEGDLAKRVDQGDVEQKGGTAGAEAEKDAVQTMIPKSARGAVRDTASEERTPSAGRKLEGDEKAKAIAELNKRMKEGKVEAARIDRPDTRTSVEKQAPAKPESVGVTEEQWKKLVKAVAEAPSSPAVDKVKAEVDKVIKAETDADVTRAGKKTNTDPSDAQKKAGNYAKGSVSWNGLNVALENPKGSARKGMAKIGGKMREWSVQMQDHYGYIKRTEGADGDQVDVFMGPNPKSDQVWVIDQQDFDGNFDEHKVMLGYDSQSEAMMAYDRAFSDKRGFERVKDIQSMSVDEFKTWVHSDKPKKAKKAAASIDSSLKTDVQSAIDPSKTIDAIQTVPAREVLKSLNLEHLAGVPKAIADLMRNRLTALVGDVDVHIVPKNEMARAAGDLSITFEPDGDGNIGLHRLGIADGKSSVLLRADALRTPQQTAHVAIHEIAHAATVRAIVEDPHLHRTILDMMQETKQFLEFVPDIRKELDYAFTDAKEFIAEAFSNPKVQEILAQIPMSADLNARTKLAGRATLWDAFVAVVRRAVDKALGPGFAGPRMIEGILRLGNSFERHQLDVMARQKRGENIRVQIKDPNKAGEVTSKLIAETRQKIEDIFNREDVQKSERAPWLKLRTMDQIAQVAGAYFRGNNPVRRIADLTEMIRVKAANNLRKSEPIIDELYSLEKKYSKQNGGKVWDDFTALLHDETMANTFADRDLASQAHLGKDTLHGAWGKAQHADLKRRYDELPEDLKAARAKAMKFFTAQQNAMSLGIIKNRILKLLGVNDDALARRIHEGRTVDTDAALVGGEDILKTIQEAKELSKIEGPYFPLMRRGEYVVRGTYDITPPSNATKISDNAFEFSGKTARKDAIAWAEKQDLHPTIESRWVDKNTGEKHFPDGTRVTMQDTDAEQRFRVTVQNRHVEFFETKAEAEKAEAALTKQPGVNSKGVQMRRWEPGDRRADMLSTQMRQLSESLERRAEYRDLSPAEKNDLVRVLNEASLRFLGSTRVQSRRLPRRYVEGASKDLTRNTLDYAQSTSGYLAKLEHQPALEDAMKAMRDAVDSDDHKTAGLARSAIANEVEQRVAASDIFEEAGTWSKFGKRLMTLSFLDKLFSPAFNIINSLQPAMVTMPTLAARYGVGKSFDALSRAYSDVSGMTVAKAGLKDSVRKARDAQADTTDLFATVKAGLSAKERAMIDYLAERGTIDPEAGMEIASLIKSRSGVTGKVDVGLGYLEGIARQMPQAIEMVNRSVTAVATYRLEIARGATHEAAMVKAQESVNNTQGLYSTSNAVPLFNHPVAKLALQFKKYGQLMYHLLGSNVGKALRNASPEERNEAIKTLVGITATHVAMAGALGLPTEPFKYLLMGAQAAGLTSTGWGDVENKVREQAASWFGKTGGEIITKGLPRAVGLDLSSRVGLDSLISFGEPKSNKDTDVKTWMFDTLAGAPAALVGDWVKGANALTSGDFVKAAELMVPMKFASDSIKAYRLATEGKKGSTGKETMAPYSFREAAMRATGFTPAREAEEGAKRTAFHNAQQRDRGERGQLMAAWVSAKPSDKFGAWKKIQSFNKGKPRDQQITMGDLTRAAARRQKEGDAIRTTKRDKDYLRRAEATYNP